MTSHLRDNYSPRLDALYARIARHFSRVEPRRRVLAYVDGLLSPGRRKNGSQLAARAGESAPDGMQRLLAGAQWDTDSVRDDLRSYVLEKVGDERAILALGNTGFVKRGAKSAGVQRQYCATTGRVENCQIGVFLGYLTGRQRVFLDRELYLPKEWATDPLRRREARVPPRVQYRSNPELAREMLERALDAGVPAGFVTGGPEYGGDQELRQWLEMRGMPYVLEVPSSQPLWAAGPHGTGPGAAQQVTKVAAQRWQRVQSPGVDGGRASYWVRIGLPAIPSRGMCTCLLARRSSADSTRLSYYLCHSHVLAPIGELIAVAMAGATMTGAFEAARDRAGLDQYEVRRYDAWYRHITLSMFAHAFLEIETSQADLPATPPAAARSVLTGRFPPHPTVRTGQNGQMSADHAEIDTKSAG
jgi:SRSO17 transposase